MNEHPDSESDWDQVVDVVCVGTSPGVLAYAICCAAADLDVLMVNPAAEPDEQTAAWYAAMTADLDPTRDAAREFSFARVAPADAPIGKGAVLEPFIGERLRQWSAQCAHSPLGVMFTQVPELLVPMRTEHGESITAALIGRAGRGGLSAWLSDRASENGLAEPENAMAAMILEGGRIAGAQLDDGHRIAAVGGLVLPVGTQADCPDLPDGYTVALVGRPAGRFAALDLLAR